MPGLERHTPHADGATHERLLPGTDDVVRLGFGPDGLAVDGPLTPAVRRWLDLDTDHAAVDAHLARDPLLAPWVAARPALRVPGSLDGWESACLTVLGQQVSLGAARTFAGRLVAALGRPGPAGLHRFPPAAAVAAAGPDAVRAATGVTGARARTVHALAAECASGLVLAPDADHAEVRRRLHDVPGIGPWTVEYVAVRVLRDADALPAGDLVLRRALGLRAAAEVDARAEPWRPFRAYGLLHVWTAAVFV